jgi:hypothetical protein
MIVTPYSTRLHVNFHASLRTQMVTSWDKVRSVSAMSRQEKITEKETDPILRRFDSTVIK